MSLNISLDNKIDPFAKPYQECSKCGGKLALRVENSPSGQKTSQICRKCGHQITTAIVNVIRAK